MGRRTVPKVAGVESQGSLILHALLTELHTAGYNWALMADVVSQGYRDAYDMHKKTLAKVKQNEESGNLQLKEMYLFVLTAVSVGFAGGLVGAAMAPWVKGVQDLASKTAFRQGFGQYILAEGSKGSAQEIAKSGYKKLFQELESQTLSTDGSPYVPLGSDPAVFALNLKTAVDDLMVAVQDPIIGLIDEANAQGWPAAVGQFILNSFRLNCPLLTDAPAKEDIPTAKAARDAAELAMWVAWANVRLSGAWGTSDISELNTLDGPFPREGSSDRDDYDWAVIHARQLEPIIGRMTELRRPHVTRIVGDLAHDAYDVLDLRKVSFIRMDSPDLPFKKLPNLANEWNRTSAPARAKYFSSLMNVTPAHKK